MAERERESEISGSLLIRALILSDQDLTLMISLDLNNFPICPISKYCHIRGYGFNIWVSRETWVSSLPMDVKLFMVGYFYSLWSSPVQSLWIHFGFLNRLISLLLRTFMQAIYLPRITGTTLCSCPFSWWFPFVLQVWAFTVSGKTSLFAVTFIMLSPQVLDVCVTGLSTPCNCLPQQIVSSTRTAIPTPTDGFTQHLTQNSERTHTQ